MSEIEPRNNLSWRVTVVEREIERLKDQKPEVIADRVSRLADDVRDLRHHMDNAFEDLRDEIKSGDAANTDELGTQRKILIGAWVSIATGLILAYVLGSGGVPT